MERRFFLRNSLRGLGSVSLAASLTQFNSAPIFAQNAVDYKAVVCLFLDGGLDCNSAVVPLDSFYEQYKANRPDLYYRQADLNALKTTSSKRSFGLHPSLTKTAALFNSGEMAILANVGTIARPTAKSDIGYADELPTNLFSHSSQINAWEMALAKQVSSTGWAGRVADAVLSSNGSGKMPAVVSTTGYHIIGQGHDTDQVTASTGTDSVDLINMMSTLQQYFNIAEQGTPYNNLQQYLADQQRRSLLSSKVITDTYAAGAVQTVFPGTALGQQFQLIAKLIAGHSVHDTRRQIFVARDGSYDSHVIQYRLLTDRLSGVDEALAAFVGAMKEIGMYNKVLVFTCSDFGRSLQQNGTGGSDHAWGGHHFILGGGVKGGDMYGTFPNLEIAGDDDRDNIGNWIPTTSMSQYLATMASWLGVPASSLPTIFPELPNFSTATLPLLV